MREETALGKTHYCIHYQDIKESFIIMSDLSLSQYPELVKNSCIGYITFFDVTLIHRMELLFSWIKMPSPLGSQEFLYLLIAYFIHYPP